MNNRAAADRRQELDQYFTPRWATEAFLHYHAPPKDALIGEPCAGDGHIVETLLDHGYSIAYDDIDESLDYGKGGDFLRDASAFRECDWIVSNPPYYTDAGTAAQMYRRAMHTVDHVAMIMRLGWLEACKDRRDLLPQLSDVLILPRVEFEGATGSGNSSPSVWCVYHADQKDGDTTITWADPALCDDLKREYAS